MKSRYRFAFRTAIPVLAHAAPYPPGTPPATFDEGANGGTYSESPYNTPLTATNFAAQSADNNALSTADVQDFGNKDLNRIQGNITKAVGRAAPYVDILEGGTIAAGVSDVVRAIVQERAVLNQSLVAPLFTDDVGIAGTVGNQAEVGSTEYTYRLQSLRGMGPLVNVKVMRSAFETSYTVSEQALKAQIIQLNNADVRNILFTLGGTKCLVYSGATSFSQMFSGNMQSLATPIPTVNGGIPDSALSFTLLQAIGRRLREDLLVEAFETEDSEPLLKFIGGQDILDFLRDDLDVRTDFRYLTAGKYTIGETTLTRYRWEGPYRGWAFGVDPQPLRFSEVSTGSTATVAGGGPDPKSHDAYGNFIPAGYPLFIEPEIRTVVAGKGVGSRPNPYWVRALYEVGFAVGANSFRRLAPAQYTGEGSYKFPPQLSMGELKWNVIIDNVKNVWGDYGRHFYQISRAIRPERPHAACAIIYKRNVPDYNLVAVTSGTDWSSTASL